MTQDLIFQLVMSWREQDSKTSKANLKTKKKKKKKKNVGLLFTDPEFSDWVGREENIFWLPV